MNGTSKVGGSQRSNKKTPKTIIHEGIKQYLDSRDAWLAAPLVVTGIKKGPTYESCREKYIRQTNKKLGGINKYYYSLLLLQLLLTRYRSIE